MNRRSLPVAAALAAAAALLLSACGSDDEPAGNDKIAGAEQGDKSSPSPSGTPAGSADRPEIKLPADVKDSFEGWKTGDATKDAVLSDAANAKTAVNVAATSRDTDEPAMSFYNQGDALRDAAKWVQWFVDNKTTYTGTIRYYSPKIELFDSKSAGVVYCSDESKAYNKDPETGKIDKTPATKKSFILYNTRLEKNDAGVWQTTDIVSQRGHKTCVQ